MFHNFLFINKIKKIFPLIKSGSRPTRLSFSGWGHVSKYYYVIAATGIWNQPRNNIEITCKKEIIIKNVIQNTKKKIYRKMLTQPSFKSKIHEKKDL